MNKNIDSKSYKRAFTLAETLITITIIGVVMALMLRAVNRVNPDKQKLLFLKSYHAVESTIAEVINDPTKYDQGYYTNAQRNEMPASERHMDFRDKPYEDASVTINGVGKNNLTQSAAICYFLADHLNTLGNVNCDSNGGDGGLNFKATNGVCFRNWSGVGTDGSINAVIDPTCEGTTNGGITVTVYRDGKMTVPQTSATTSALQSTAYNWMMNQTDLK